MQSVQTLRCFLERLLWGEARPRPLKEIPPSFFDAHQLTVGDYLECFVTAVRPSGNDEWIVPYPAQTAPPTGSNPEFDPNEIRATVTQCEVKLE
jgi:hypothetical protein